jgi:F-type H+-transporting ATPase subunit epsilon
VAELKISVVTPESTAFEAQTPFVVVPLYDGELGIAVHHSPMIGRLGYGELRIGQGASARRFYVDGGFVQVADNQVTVLTNRAVAAEKLSAAAATSALEAARARESHSPELLEIREREVARARAQLRMASRA